MSTSRYGYVEPAAGLPEGGPVDDGLCAAPDEAGVVRFRDAATTTEMG